ncbi:uncharacterized protein LOC134823377 [Bolinopsis microptera]|uniref:uncharacterized protein LOC134823377 n=1 Tax=Bolinopsis microptera TaxID=2820187 RepID=UPI00307AEE9E
MPRNLSANCRRIIIAVSTIATFLVFVPIPEFNSNSKLEATPEIIPEFNSNSKLEVTPEISYSRNSANYTKYVDRSNYIKNLCSTNHPVNHVTSPQDIINMSPELDVFWCPLFKVGSSQWVKLFCGVADLSQPEHINPGVHEPLLHEQLPCNIHVLRAHNGHCKEQACVGSQTSFMVVRDPVARFLSAFRSKWELANENTGFYWNERGGRQAVSAFRHVNTLLYNKNPHELMQEANTVIKNNRHNLHMIVENTRRNKSYILTPEEHYLIHNQSNPYLNPPGPTLRELVKWVLSGGRDNHITPFYKYCAPCTLDYVILKLDKFPDEAFDLLDMIGHPALKPEMMVQSETRQVPWKTEECMIRYYRTLPVEDFKKMYETMWRVDCELYQYPCQEFYDKVIEMGPSDEDFVLC